MKFYQAFIVATYLTVISGILSLSLAEGSPFYIIIGIIGSLGSLYFVDLRFRFHISRGVGTFLSVLAFIYLMLDIFYVSGFFVLSFTHFLIIIQIIKLYLEKENRDFAQIYLISFMHLIVTSVLTTNIVFSVLFVIYILCATWVMILFHLKTEGSLWKSKNRFAENRRKNKAELKGLSNFLQKNDTLLSFREKRFISGHFFFNTSVITLVILFLTVIIFLMIPRYSAGLFVSKLGKTSKLTGFSGKVNLNSIGSIKLDYSPVLRMELLNYQGGYDREFYIRGIAFDHYSKGYWKNKCERSLLFYANSNGDIYPTFGGDTSWMNSIIQKFTVEALDTRVLFHVYPLKSLKSKFKRLTLDSSSNAYTPYPYFRGAQYEVTSGLLPVYEKPPKVFKSYTRFTESCFLNQSGINDKIRKLALNIIEKIRNKEKKNYHKEPRTDNRINPFLQAKAIEMYLKENYQYTLNNPSGGKYDPVSDFLFNSKAGHCEYYASAMVLMLRSINIPARLVTGFKTNEWNDIGQYYLVRQKDAHSWIEAYFYPIGWYPFDPTPPIMDEPLGLYGMTVNTTLGKYIDFIKMKWNSWVINYSFEAQKFAFQKIKNKTKKMRNEFFKWVTIWRIKTRNFMLSKYISLKTLFWLLAGLIFFGVLTHILYRYIKTTLFFRSILKRKIKISVRFYAELLRILKRKGINRNPTHTPYEFLDQNIDKNSEEFEGFKIITDLFYKVRYGNKKLSSEEIEIVTDILYKLKYGKAAYSS